jgi:hypothetical protein
MWFIIGFVSAFDVFCAIKYQKTLLSLEENPLGRYLIRASNGDISLFMGLKVAGVVLVLGFLQNAFHLGDKKRKGHILIITLGVTLFQIWLLCYLNT